MFLSLQPFLVCNDRAPPDVAHSFALANSGLVASHFAVSLSFGNSILCRLFRCCLLFTICFRRRHSILCHLWFSVLFDICESRRCGKYILLGLTRHF